MPVSNHIVSAFDDELKDIERNDTLKVTPLRHHADILVEALDLSICYGERVVTGPLDFTLRQGDRAVLLGKNGSGNLGEHSGRTDRYTGFMPDRATQ